MGKSKPGHKVPLLSNHVEIPEGRSGNVWVDRQPDKPALYGVLAAFLRFCMNVFFAKIEVVGRHFVSKEGQGPVIFAGNHPNALLDPVMVLTQCRRVVRFGAKDTLFDNPVIRFFAHNLGAVPIRRRQDNKDPDAPVDNTGAFDCFYNVLEHGGTVGLFPEGVSHTESQLFKLKTGTARVALHVAKHLYHDNAPRDFELQIVPCGLNYDVRHQFRSRVLLQFGMPITVGDEWVQRAVNNERETVVALTEELDRAIREVTLNAEDWDTLHLLNACVHLLVRKKGGAKLSYTSMKMNKRLLEGYRNNKDELDVVSFRQDLEDYCSNLDELNLKDHHVRDASNRAFTTVFFLQRLLFFLILMPFAIVGIAFHFPVVLLSYVAGRRYGHEKDVIATYKILIAIMFVPVIYITTIIVTGVVTRNLHPWLQATIILAMCVLLPVSGYAMVRFYEIEARVGRAAMRFIRVIHYNKSVMALAEQRSTLEERLRSLIGKYKGTVSGAGGPSPRPRAESMEVRRLEDEAEAEVKRKSRKKKRKGSAKGKERATVHQDDSEYTPPSMQAMAAPLVNEGERGTDSGTEGDIPVDVLITVDEEVMEPPILSSASASGDDDEDADNRV